MQPPPAEEHLHGSTAAGLLHNQPLLPERPERKGGPSKPQAPAQPKPVVSHTLPHSVNPDTNPFALKFKYKPQAQVEEVPLETVPKSGSRGDACNSADPFEGLPLDSKRPLEGVPPKVAAQWKKLYNAMKAELHQVSYGGELLRSLLKRKSDELREQRARLLCHYFLPRKMSKSVR